MAKTTSQTSPEPTSKQLVRVDGQQNITGLEIHRFSDWFGVNKKFNYEQTLEYSKSIGKEMLSIEEATRIRASFDSSQSCQLVLGPGEWAFVQNKDAPLFPAAVFHNGRHREFDFIDNEHPLNCTSVIILKKTSLTVAEQQTMANNVLEDMKHQFAGLKKNMEIYEKLLRTKVTDQ
jgi:hypothetical protein